MSDRCELCGGKISFSRPGRSVDWVHVDCWENVGVSNEEIAGSRGEWELVEQAVRDLFMRDMNHGDWPRGVPDSFREVGEKLGVLVEDDAGWVLVVEQWVRRQATAMVAARLGCMGD